MGDGVFVLKSESDGKIIQQILDLSWIRSYYYTMNIHDSILLYILYQFILELLISLALPSVVVIEKKNRRCHIVMQI